MHLYPDFFYRYQRFLKVLKNLKHSGQNIVMCCIIMIEEVFIYGLLSNTGFIKYAFFLHLVHYEINEACETMYNNENQLNKLSFKKTF